MRKLTPLAIFAIVVDLFLLGVCILHLPSVAGRPRVPFTISELNGRVLVDAILDERAANGLRTGDEVVTWNAEPLRTSEYLEFAADCDSIGSTVSIGYRRAGLDASTNIILLPYYTSARFVVISGFVGLAFWLIGIFILLSRPNDHAGRVLHWSIILMAATVTLTQGRIVPSEMFSVLARALLLLVYPLTGATFLYFSVLYPGPKLGSRILKAFLIFSPAVLVTAVLMVHFFRAAFTIHPSEFLQFQLSYDICHFLLLLYGIGTVASVIHSYAIARTTEERRRLQWMMWGFAVGPTPFIALIIIPQLLFSNDLVPEEYATLFLIVVPFSLAISFLKYQLLDIGVLINRSIVYFVLTLFIGSIYVSAALLLASAIGGARVSEEYFLVVAMSLVIAILLNPLRNRVQRFVDVTLFPARSRFRELTKEISSEFHTVLSTDQMSDRITAVVRRLLPVSAVAVYRYADRVMTLQGKPSSNLLGVFRLSGEHAKEIGRPKIYASSAAVSFHRDDVDTAKERLLGKLGFSVGLPLLGESGQLLGMLVANPRAQAKRFDEGEVDLLATIAHEAEEVLDRLRLQEEFFAGQQQKKHAEELNALKSYFVSSVSHELRTPLTSVRLFADSLREQKVARTKEHKEYLDIIIGETDRLGRLINNVLDFSRIEQGLKEFRFTRVDLLGIVRESVAAMQYQMRMNGASLKLTTPRRLPLLEADKDALQEVILNLLSNALKYSSEKKVIRLTVRRKGDAVELAVADKGNGISEKDLSHIFEQFYRSKDGRGGQAGGVGLGLTVVKHIVEAHQGTISVASKLGSGSTFVVKLPLMRHIAPDDTAVADATPAGDHANLKEKSR